MGIDALWLLVDVVIASPFFSDALEATQAIKRLYDGHAPSLRRALARLTLPGSDVDDLLQEVFVVALRQPERVLGAQSPKAWLYGIAVKVASSTRTRQRLRQMLNLDQANDVADQRDDATAVLQRKDAVRQVHRALASLSNVRREAFVLFELEGLSGPDIAQALGIPVKTVWTRLFHARRDFEAAVRREAAEP